MVLQKIVAGLAILGLSAGCAQEDAGTPPPTDAFHYPVSLALHPAEGVAQTLYVASSNFDLLYNRGTVLAVANRFRFDAVEVVHMGCGGDQTEDRQHGTANDD